MLEPSIDLVGTLEAVPERTAAISAQTEGRIQAVPVVEGERVEIGQVLFELDPRPAEAGRRRAEAAVRQQQAVLDRLEQGYLPQEIEMARQEAQKAKAELESLRLRVRAATRLHENNEVSDVEFERLQSTLRQSEAAYASAAAKLDLYRAGTRPERIAEAQARLDAAEAELARAKLAVAYCTTSSPIAGVVTQLPARQGMHVVPSDRLATVVDLSQIFVRIRVPGGYLSSVKLGAVVEASLPSVEEDRFEGNITRFSGAADPKTGDVQAFATLHNAQGRLKPGLTCRVRVHMPSIEQALVVPVSALADREGTSVLHVVRDHKAYEVQVSTGASTRQYVQITKGLSEGDLVITKGGYGLPDGCPVEQTSPE